MSVAVCFIDKLRYIKILTLLLGNVIICPSAVRKKYVFLYVICLDVSLLRVTQFHTPL